MTAFANEQNQLDRYEMPKFRKRPVIIEARQLSFENVAELAVWCGGDVAGKTIDIHTLEGTHKACQGDWIIRGVEGEFYPCKPHIFEQTYEAVAETA